MNDLEKAICAAVKKAHRRYVEITDNWLFHAPEHFLQNFIFNSLGKTHWVYAEATRRKIANGCGRPPRGRPPNRKTYRYDLVVWHKTTYTRDPLRAVIEVKRAWRLDGGLKKDAERIKSALKGSQRAKSGYLVVYTEVQNSKGVEALVKTLKDWACELGLTLLNQESIRIERERTSDGWICGFGLMRA